MLKGACYCRAVTFEVDDAFEYAFNCHCSNCRRTTGAAFKPFAGIASDRLHLFAKAKQLLVYGDRTANDTHCASCGSLIYSTVREGCFVHIPLGVLLDCPSISPTGHIFVGSKAPWFKITDDLPQFQEFPQ